MADVAPYGAWTSPLSAAMVAGAGLRLGAVTLDGDYVYWLEGRPAEAGRTVLVRRGADGVIEEVTPREFNVRSRVHEYGGGAYAVADGVVYVSNFADHRVYRMRHGEAPEALTPEAPCYYADFAVDHARQQVICVREDHGGPGEPINAIVRIRAGATPAPADASTPAEASALADAPASTAGGAGVDVLVSGHDFYSTPRLSPDGTKLAWLAWRHPQMPWDGTELWVAGVAADGTLTDARHVAGSETESIYQPGWSPDGTLYFVSDSDGWWKLYRLDGQPMKPVARNAPADAEFGRPQWVLGTASWAFAGPDRIVTAYTQGGRWHLATVHAHTGLFTRIDTDRAPGEWLAADARQAVLVAGAPALPDAVVRLDTASGRVDVLRAASELHLDAGYISLPEAIEFPTEDGLTAHAFYYPPRNKDFVPPRGERPPLIVISHGGPTHAARATFDPGIQFWTSRGFAVADVNYGGSSGFGRPYRERLKGEWGIRDVADVVNAARYLVTQGRADVRRLVARGGSAGGYTTLAALAFYPGVFAAGASYYGVSDIEVLARDTHKFEARYLDTLVGPYPEAKAVYRARSPIHFVDRLACALILFQGLDDKVVPPNQSESMAEAVRRKGRPVEYHAFEGEQHGFRRAQTIVQCLEAELAFYRRVL